MARNSTQYVCQSCGAVWPKWSGKCDQCGTWNSLVETNAPSSSASKRGSGRATAAHVESLKSVDLSSHVRLPSGVSEVDAVLGGGMVPGGVMLLSGDPGVGKSTLVLQVAAHVAAKQNVLYVSGEESERQIKMRADRLGLGGVELDLLSETNVETVLASIEAGSYSLVIIDSIQTMYTDSLTGSAGSVGQITASAQRLAALAKHHNIAMLIIGHVTKEGSIAGPKILEHLVDVVLYLEGDKYGNFKALRGVKNRYGSTNEVGILEMGEKGLSVVPNPSEALLAERQQGPGSVVFVTLEGTRPLLVEVQALASTTPFGYPKRTAVGFDLNRLNLLVAVLQKRAGINLSNQDIYVNIVGGLKVSEPAADLAIILAIASAYKNSSVPAESVCFGEVGLSGEIRSVSQVVKRLGEATKLGFTKAYGPARQKQPKLIGLGNVASAIETVFKTK